MITIACLASVFTVNAYQIDCPKEMTIKVKVEEMPDGWEISEDRTYTSSFFNLGLFYDKPANKASLVPNALKVVFFFKNFSYCIFKANIYFY